MESKVKHFAKAIIQKGMKDTVDDYINRDRHSKECLAVIRKHHLLGEQTQTEREKLTYAPLISIITPLYNTKESYLKELIDSVRSQTYENWELCLADGSDAEHDYVGELCRKCEETDGRFHYKKLDKNEGIVGNTNQCLSLASGEYYALLDHDDLLHPRALAECVKAMNQGADFIYTDEMKFSRRVQDATDIVCKNDFSRYELRSHNYICHLVVFQAQLLEGMDELYRLKCEGSQDYDMVLRLTEKAKKIVHIPKILYYWRVHEGSVAMDLSVKQYAVDAAKTAIADHLKRTGEVGKVECNYPYETIYRVDYETKELPRITIIWDGNISIKKHKKYLHQLMENTEYPALEIVCKGKEEKRLKAPNISLNVVKDQDIHRYLWANQMSKRASGELLLFMDWSWIPQNKDWLKELAVYAVREDVGVAGPFVKDKLNRVVSAGVMLDKQSENGLVELNRKMDADQQGYEANMKHVRSVAALPGDCLMVSKEKYEEAGGFDTAMSDYADADLCLKLKKMGMENIWTPFSELTAAKNKDCWREANLPFLDKWIYQRSISNEEIEGLWCHPLLEKLKYI